MQCSFFKVLLAGVILAIPAVAISADAPARYNVGTPLSEAEIKSFDEIVGPKGQNLPPGHGSAIEGRKLYADRCETCHGVRGKDGVLGKLVLGSPGKPWTGDYYGGNRRSISFYPYATIAWDFINRAMPASKPGSLTKNEVYAIVAYLYYENGIIDENFVLDEKTLPKVLMPNRDGFVPAVVTYPPPKNQPSWY